MNVMNVNEDMKKEYMSAKYTLRNLKRLTRLKRCIFKKLSDITLGRSFRCILLIVITFTFSSFFSQNGTS